MSQIPAAFTRGLTESPTRDRHSYVQLTPTSEESFSLKSVSRQHSSGDYRAVSVHSLNLSGSDEPGVGYRLRRFWIRGLVGVVVPPLVTAAYMYIWRFYLVPSDPDNPMQVGYPGALTAFYSWFVVGTIGLNLSKYGLVGVEASMLMEPKWSAKNAMQLLMHSDHTWSGPGGWMNVGRKILFLRRQEGSKVLWPTKLWIMLATISLLAFTALPISGLCMELGDGYMEINGNPLVLGRNLENFNDRIESSLYEHAQMNWRLNMPVKLPVAGIVYTLPGADRKDAALSWLQPQANLPIDDGVDKIFLAPQAENPIDGETSGLVVSYNCSIVKRLDDFTILSEFNRRGETTRVLNNTDPRYNPHGFRWDNFGNNTAFVRPHTNTYYGANLQAVSQIAASSLHDIGYENVAYRYYSSKPLGDMDPRPVYRNLGLGHDYVLEYALHQHLSAYNDTGITNHTIDYEIEELKGTYNTDPRTLWPSTNMSAVGVRCTSSSEVGTAKIDGRANTYSDFVPKETTPQISRKGWIRGAIPISQGVIRIFLWNPQAEQASGQHGQGLSYIETSVEAKPPKDMDGYLFQPAYIQASQLRQSLLQAYANYALSLAYDGIAKFDDLQKYPTDEDVFRPAFLNENVTTSRPGKVMTSGVVPAVFPAILLSIWCAASVLLGSMYGFRRRWAATLDGYSMFRFGADFGEVVTASTEFSSTEDYETCETLKSIPGLVGDARERFVPGHVTLVRRTVASKEKLYR